ncbi:MAG: hypothetical protein JO325_02960 [Solirubrobacterales bacterium]|nr:hypothetical protein [Solirubrobacterales bacterium]
MTVVAEPRDTAMRRRVIGRLAWLSVAVASVAGVATASVVGVDSLSGGRQPGPAIRSHASGAAPGSRYPLTCVSVAIALHDPRFMHASFDRTIPCARGLDSGGARPRPWRAVRGHQWASA